MPTTNTQLNQLTAQFQRIVNRAARVADRYLAGKSMLAQEYQKYVPDSAFARLIRGRVIERHAFKRIQQLGIRGLRINRTLGGLRPDLYHPNVGGCSVIWDIGSAAKTTQLGKYAGLADKIIPLIYS